MSVSILVFVIGLVSTFLGAHAQEPTTLPTALSFENRFAQARLNIGNPGLSLKFGGPCVADLNSDGFYDLVLTFHNANRSRIYINQGDGTFRIYRSPITGRFFAPKVLDVHGVAVAQLDARSSDRLISFSVGGGRGSNPRSAEIYRITKNLELEEVTNQLGFGGIASRPRNTVFMDMSLKTNGRRRREGGGPDALFVNFLIPPLGLSQFAYRNVRGMYDPVMDLGAFNAIRRGRTEVMDVNGDGVMEVISIQDLRVFQLSGPFTFVDITNNVFPSLNLGRFTVTAVAELDYDNDGRMDLYLARADRTLVTRLPPIDSDMSDILLRNVGGRYVDVTSGSGIPSDSNTVGLSIGDFNNDGNVDVLAVQHKEDDLILLGNGEGQFETVSGLIPKDTGVIGNHAVAVDYDRDGYVDAIVGHGGVGGANRGPYLLMRNNLGLTGEGGNYLHVRVLNDPSRASTSLHAVVTVFLPRRKRLTRRVGSVGAQLGGGSYLDVVHFGVGDRTILSRVMVRWSSRVLRNRRDVPVNQMITFGVE